MPVDERLDRGALQRGIERRVDAIAARRDVHARALGRLPHRIHEVLGGRGRAAVLHRHHRLLLRALGAAAA